MREVRASFRLKKILLVFADGDILGGNIEGNMNAWFWSWRWFSKLFVGFFANLLMSAEVLLSAEGFVAAGTLVPHFVVDGFEMCFDLKIKMKRFRPVSWLW